MPEPPLSWERKADEEEERQRRTEQLRRSSVDDIRRAEANLRKAREKEAAKLQEAKVAEQQDKQRMLEAVDRPLVDLLLMMNFSDQFREHLCLVLAQHNLTSLDKLLDLPRQRLPKSLGVEGLDAMDRVVVAARRKVAHDRIMALKLPEDEAAEQELAERRAKENDAGTFQMSAAQKAYYATKRGETSSPRSDGTDSPGRLQSPGAREEDRPPLGPLRLALIECTNRWFDYLGTQPALGELLSSANAAPTWKHTVSWSLWMLVTRDSPAASTATNTSSCSAGALRTLAAAPSGTHAGASSIASSSADGFGGRRRAIIRNLRYAQEYVWKALYPSLDNVSSAEWRVYWQRVNSSFTGFFSDKGSDRWKEIAAADARAAAVRAGKSAAEQRQAAAQAERLVAAMLKAPPRRMLTRTPPQERPEPSETPKEETAPPPDSSSRTEARVQPTIPVNVRVSRPASAAPITGSATWPPRSAAVIVPQATERYKNTPSRYLQTSSQRIRVAHPSHRNIQRSRSAGSTGGQARASQLSFRGGQASHRPRPNSAYVGNVNTKRTSSPTLRSRV